MNRTLSVSCILTFAMFAGCTDGHAETHLVIKFAGNSQDLNLLVPVDLDTRPSQGQYDAKGATHPDYFTAHDQLEAWHRTGGSYDTGYNANFGFSLVKLAGVRADYTQDGAYWSLSLNGEDAIVGMSTLQVRDGDVVTWTYTPA